MILIELRVSQRTAAHAEMNARRALRSLQWLKPFLQHVFFPSAAASTRLLRMRGVDVLVLFFRFGLSLVHAFNICVFTK